MCNFCVQHGDGKRWYLNASHYARDLEADLARRGYMIDFVSGFARNRRLTLAGLRALRAAPRPIAEAAKERLSAGFQQDHFGQPVPIEDCERILSIATQISRVPCVCRDAAKTAGDGPSCCLVMTVHAHDQAVADAFKGFAGGPDAGGLQKLTKEEALALLRSCEEQGLCHTAWTFKTPFVAALCNCDLPSGCLAMRLQLQEGVRIMWRGEEVVRRDEERCTHCARCVDGCPFGAFTEAGKGRVALDRAACWGCGTCRTHCAGGALALEPRGATPDMAGHW
jgi:NAD-dependent dihydropyrimidine dehydrogenase PreA subunit